ncbi:MAG: SDR family oxidoreductase [Alphaproteobacteria bacterium]|nr:SDR family oxidoreductase [Alphaproteobacteria bacterium]
MAAPGIDLTGQHAFITGASSGLGAHFAKVLSSAGATVGLAARRADKLAEVAATLDGPAHVIEMDVTAPDSIAAGLDAYLHSAGQLPDILINNAGIADPAGFLQADREKTQAVFATNQMAVMDVTQDLCRRWVANGQGGNVIHISSITGLRAVGGAAAYAASKAAVAHLTKIQALELARHQIRVNAIAPGYFATEINEDFLETDAGQALIKRIPMRRCGTRDDLNGALLLLASGMSAYMTGTVIPVDGGHLCSSL